VKSRYLRTDEREDLLSSLKLVHVSAHECRSDVQFWKWVLVGTHSTLQAALVFHLSHGNSLLVAKPAHVKKWLQAYRSGSDYPDMHMDFFLELYERAKSVEVLGFRLVTDRTQDKSVEWLLEFRNEFIHFMPKAWSIELAGLPEICLDSLEVVRALAQGPIRTRWESDAQAERFAYAFNLCRDLLQEHRVAVELRR